MALRATMMRLCTLLVLLSLLCLQASGHGGVDDGDNPPPDSVDPRAKGLIAVKVWCLVILLVFTFLGGVSPYFYRWNESFLLLGTQFAAGIFLGTSLMHFLADSTSTFAALTTNPYPFSFMLACAGFLLTMLSDCIIVAVTQKTKIREAEKEEGNSEDSAIVRETGIDKHPMFVRTTSFEDAVLLIIALCFHSVFEGIAIGVSATKSDAWKNLWTVGLHKIFAAVAMGIALLRMIPKRPFLMTVVYSLAFAISSPIGVAIGIGIDATTQGAAANWVYAISMGFATGVFIYVAINHLIAKGFKPQEPNYFDKPFYKFFALVLGVAVMAVVMIWD